MVLMIPVVQSESFTIMTFNAQNLFDIKDDKGKDDKAYLPLELKQNEEHQRSCSNINVKAWRNECFFLDWNEETKDAKDKADRIVSQAQEKATKIKLDFKDWKIEALDEVARLKIKGKIENINKAGLKDVLDG